MKKKLSIIIVISLLVLLAVPAYAASLSFREQKANDVLYTVRTTLGYTENGSVFGAATRDLYAYEFGDKSVSGDFFYSSRTGTIYFMDGTTKKINDPGDINIGECIGGGGTNLKDYDYYYRGKNLYSGVITGIDNYVDIDQARLLAKMLGSSVKSEKSQTKQAAVGWSVLYCLNGPENLTEQRLKQTYSWYDTNAKTVDDSGRDLLELAKDIIFRWQAMKYGNSYYGQPIPSDYTWLCYYQNGTTACRNTEKGGNYTFPDAQSSTKSVLRTPYTN